MPIGGLLDDPLDLDHADLPPGVVAEAVWAEAPRGESAEGEGAAAKSDDAIHGRNSFDWYLARAGHAEADRRARGVIPEMAQNVVPMENWKSVLLLAVWSGVARLVLDDLRAARLMP